MTDIVLRDIDPVLAERIRRVGETRGWELPQTLQWLLEQGLYASEQEAAGGFEEGEADVLKAAIAALEQVPDDPGFALIGRSSAAGPPRDDPDQSITEFTLD